MTGTFTFITPFFQRHGVGYLDVILHTADKEHNSLSSVDYQPKEHDQYDAFTNTLKNGKLSQLNKVFYLLPKGYKNHKDAPSRWKEFVSKEKINLIKESIESTSNNPKNSEVDLDKLITYLNKEDGLFPSYEWLKGEWREMPDLWHIINEFSLATQVEWYKNHSPVYQKHNALIHFVEIDTTYSQLENEYEVTAALKKWTQQEIFNEHTYINLWGTATAFQLAWHYLAWSSPRLKPISFIKCKTLKATKDKQRFTPLIIEAVNKNLLDKLEQHSQKATLSQQQNNTAAWLKKYKSLDDNFTILLLGPKGTGKTKVVAEIYNENSTGEDNRIISINCAQFQSNPEIARSELFGHVKGSFTGASENKEGAFNEANNKVLFLDEIHHLDKATQSMLLTALQTDNEGFFRFSALGTTNIQTTKFQLIVASNIKQESLEAHILPDLLDRISQRVLKFDALKSGTTIKKEFNSVWMFMKISEDAVNPLLSGVKTYDSRFEKWLTKTSHTFEGNYRDLQKIAILCADYQRSCDNPDLIPSDLSLVEYIKTNWRIKTRKKDITIENFLDEHNRLSLKEITNEFKSKLVRSAEILCGDQKSAAKMLGITAKSLIEIKKRDEPS